MNPAFSVILLTTLTGAAQGLFLALSAAEVWSTFGNAEAHSQFFEWGAALCVVLGGLGLVASFFHLGRPGRAWRAAACWRTSWLSREVIVLPLFVAVALLFGLEHARSGRATLPLAVLGSTLAIALFVCTGMIYACIRFLQEWSSPLTVVNYGVLGSASGVALASALSAVVAPEYAASYGAAAATITLLGLFTRSISLVRNARLRHKSSVQTAIGVRHPRIEQKSQGFMGGSFNTREFFHGRSSRFLRHVRKSFLIGAFLVPLVLLVIALATDAAFLFPVAFIVQFLGLIAERWYFFAEANHPQNLYYQAIA
jgi:DMSO reductase anchor subunit